MVDLVAVTDFASEDFPSLKVCSGLEHAFILRHPGIAVAVRDKSRAMRRLEPGYRAAVEALGFSWEDLQTAEQVHGARIGIVDNAAAGGFTALPHVDGLMTARRGVLLGILVADCCAVYLVDPVRHVLALVHSGRRGTELGIVPGAIRLMSARFESQPEDLIVQLSPCIRPPHYEIDFAASIRQQAREMGVPSPQIHDCGRCTASDLTRYYSYRAEKGRTGRMLALLGYAPSAA